MENWKPVVGYEGLYEVSDCGNVKSLLHFVEVVRNMKYPTPHIVVAKKPIKEKVLSPSVKKTGRRYVSLSKDKVVISYPISRLMLEAFVGGGAGVMALHKDDDQTNDTLGNLYWGTGKDNMDDKIANGGVLKGAAHPNASLTEAQVREIRVQLAAGVNHHTLAAIYNVLPTAIQSIKHRRTWKWLN